MKASMLLPIALWATSGALAWTTKARRECSWHGTSPFCGGTEHSIWDKDQGQILIATTKYRTRNAVCHRMGFPSEYTPNPCLDDYGGACLAGYKRLWCKENPGLDNAPEGSQDDDRIIDDDGASSPYDLLN